VQRKNLLKKVNKDFTYYGQSLSKFPIQTYPVEKKFFVDREYRSTSGVSATVEQIVEHKGMGA
jgi:hypothetical protein